jgi:hypothetical protein
MLATQQANPDPKLAFVSAEAFLEICKVLTAAINSGNRGILSLALATNAAFSLEMYLKCLLLLEEQRAPHLHDMHDLFHALSSSTQSELIEAHENFVSFNPSFIEQARQTESQTDLENLLKLGRNAFTDFRYVHERIPSETVWGLNGLTKCVRERILELQPSWNSALQEVADAEEAE